MGEENRREEAQKRKRSKVRAIGEFNAAEGRVPLEWWQGVGMCCKTAVDWAGLPLAVSAREYQALALQRRVYPPNERGPLPVVWLRPAAASVEAEAA